MICMVVTESRQSFMAATLSSSSIDGSKFSMAVMPCGTVLLGMTTTCLSDRGAACSAAMMMFLLLGRTNTISAGVRSMALRMSSVEGFMV